MGVFYHNSYGKLPDPFSPTGRKRVGSGYARLIQLEASQEIVLLRLVQPISGLDVIQEDKKVITLILIQYLRKLRLTRAGFPYLKSPQMPAHASA